jgi:glucose-6-phosphate isomerase
MTVDAGYNAELADLAPAVAARLAKLDAERVTARLWGGDPTVWTDDPATSEIRDRLGWLRLPATMPAQCADLTAFAAAARGEFSRVVLCGMGGSSLAPEVLWNAFGRAAGFPDFVMLDSTDPDAVAAVESADEMDSTLVVVASKSGSTIETDSAMRRLWRGHGAQFVAITDAESPLEAHARAAGFRRAFANPADIGGRYSALSLFGLVPAALVGIDIAALLERGARMAAACTPERRAAHSPGAWLGAVLGEAALRGRDKLTVFCPPPLDRLGLWIEQLVAESSGKEGRGIVPVIDEPIASAGAYGDDRVFVAFERRRAANPHAAALAALAAAGHPVVRIGFDDALDLGGEFFRWEMATAVACSILRVNAFDQPNVAESKRNTMDVLAAGGAAPAPASTLEEARAWLAATRPGEYLAILLFTAPSAAADRRLRDVRVRWRERTHAATTAGYGPRYLHSTGQLHKGGPRRGRFALITTTPEQTVEIPGRPWDFAALLRAQAEGDRRALAARDLPVIALHGLDALESI